MSNHRSFIRGAAALQSLTLSLASYEDQIRENKETGYPIQASHLLRDQRIVEISGAFEPLTDDLLPVYRRVFNATTRATQFPDQMPHLVNNDIISAAQSLAFAPALSKGTPAERSNIEVWSTSFGEHLAVGTFDFDTLGASHFLISQWSEGKLSDERDIRKMYRTMVAKPKTKREPKIFRIDLLNVGKGSAIMAGTLGFIALTAAGIAFAFSAAEKNYGDQPGMMHNDTVTVCDVIKTNQTYVIETPDGAFLREIRSYTYVRTGGGSHGGGKGSKGGGNGGGQTKVIQNPMPIAGETYDIKWEEKSESFIRSMKRSTQKGSGCSQ